MKIAVLLLAAFTGSSVYSARVKCKHKLDIVAVLDGSGSIDADDFTKLKNFAIQLINDLDIGQNGQSFGAVVFSSGVSSIIPLSTDRKTLLSAVSKIRQPRGGTATHLGIDAMKKMFESKGRKKAKKIGIVITDGRSNSESKTVTAAANARRRDITLFAVGVGGNVNNKELLGIADFPENVLKLDNFDALKTKLNDLVRKICIVDGGWSSWSSVSSQCSTTCGPGVRTITMTRKCNNPAPENGGKDCPGNKTKSIKQICKVKKCPVDGEWSDWSSPSRSQCSVTCGSGVITVTHMRTCKPPKYGGKPCHGSRVKTYKETCKKKKCLLCGECTCDGCHYENGVGFMPHPTDCRFFLQCVNWGASYHIKRCPSHLYWNQKVLTCTEKSLTNCSHIATAAPIDVQVTVTPAPAAPPPASGCDGTKTPISGKLSAYHEDVPGYGLVERQCLPGTVYSSRSCTCEYERTGQIQSSGCDPELYLPLRRNLKDHSKHRLYIEKNHIEITKSGYASFARNDSMIRINRFSNTDFGKTLQITFQMYRGQYTGQGQAILSNAQCDKKGSIYVIQKASAIKFQVENDKGVYSTLEVPMVTSHADVSLTIDEGVMSAVVNKNRKEIPFQGGIGRVHCALQLGQSAGYANFSGMLREFKVYMCVK